MSIWKAVLWVFIVQMSNIVIADLLTIDLEGAEKSAGECRWFLIFLIGYIVFKDAREKP